MLLGFLVELGYAAVDRVRRLVGLYLEIVWRSLPPWMQLVLHLDENEFAHFVECFGGVHFAAVPKRIVALRQCLHQDAFCDRLEFPSRVAFLEFGFFDATVLDGDIRDYVLGSLRSRVVANVVEPSRIARHDCGIRDPKRVGVPERLFYRLQEF